MHFAAVSSVGLGYPDDNRESEGTSEAVLTVLKSAYDKEPPLQKRLSGSRVLMILNRL